MTRDDLKDLTLSILVVVALLFAADAICLHWRLSACSTREKALMVRLDAVEKKLQNHINPPKELSFTDKAKNAYDRVKQVVKEEFANEKKIEK